MLGRVRALLQAGPVTPGCFRPNGRRLGGKRRPRPDPGFSAARPGKRRIPMALCPGDPSGRTRRHGRADFNTRGGRNRCEGIRTSRPVFRACDHAHPGRYVASGARRRPHHGAGAAERALDVRDMRGVRFALNFANIVALPLLFGVGVAFNVYFVMAWRAGETAPLQASLMRAVLLAPSPRQQRLAPCGCRAIPRTANIGRLLMAHSPGSFVTLLFRPALCPPSCTASARMTITRRSHSLLLAALSWRPDQSWRRSNLIARRIRCAWALPPTRRV